MEFGGTSTFKYDSENWACDGVLGVLDADTYVRPLSLGPGQRMLFSRAELEAELGHALPTFEGGPAAGATSAVGAAAGAAGDGVGASTAPGDEDVFEDAEED